MKRRTVLAAPLALASHALASYALVSFALVSCALSQRPYVERRDWPLDIRRPVELPPRARGKILLVRAIRPGPGLEARGLQSIEPDGSIRTAFYEEWAAQPAQAVEDGLRRWLAASGRFAAVIGPGSRLSPDITLDGELTALWTDAARGEATAALAVAAYADPGHILIQREFRERSPLAAPNSAPAKADAMRAALAKAFQEIENAFPSP